ncbi:MAG TPA: hypothetical protein VFJ84_00840 [Candidatus Saccharimonadales bacterium]|nr:hypothetical protein [Candidatus Saccharimonadales bacterium]
MSRIAGLFFMFTLPLLALSGSAAAQQYNRTITVYAYVPEMRGIYIDNSGKLIKVAGNTGRDITPQAFDASGKLIAMASSYMSQYQAFLAQHGGRLEAGKIYTIKRVEPGPELNLKPVKSVHRKSQANQQAGNNYRYIGPKMKMALVY